MTLVLSLCVYNLNRKDSYYILLKLGIWSSLTSQRRRLTTGHPNSKWSISPKRGEDNCTRRKRGEANQCSWFKLLLCTLLLNESLPLKGNSSSLFYCCIFQSEGCKQDHSSVVWCFRNYLEILFRRLFRNPGINWWNFPFKSIFSQY